MMLQCRLAWEEYIDKYGFEEGTRLYSLDCDAYDDYIRAQEEAWQTQYQTLKAKEETMHDTALLGVLLSHAEPTPYMKHMINQLKHKFGIGGHSETLDVEAAKGVSILSVVSSYDIDVARGMAKCPFHEDHTPSMKIYEQTNSFYCFGCCAGGDVIDFVAKKENMTFREAVKRLNNI